MRSERNHSIEISAEATGLGLNALVLCADDIAGLFGRSKSWFYLHRQELEEAGFPAQDPLLRGWSTTAVLNWFNLRNSERPKKRSPLPTWGRGLRGQEYSGAHLD